MEPGTPTPVHNRSMLIATVALLAVIAGGVFLVRQQSEASNPAPLAASTPCEGKLFDSHVHLDEDAYLQTLVPRMDEHGVGCAVVFVGLNPANPDWTRLARLAEYPGRFVPFLHVNPRAPADIDPARWEPLLAERPGTFKGFGEIALYRPPFQSTRLTDEPWSAVFDAIARHDLWLMLHLRDAEQLPELETMLARYPRTKVLLHGPELRTELPELLTHYPNLAYTLDTATLLERPIPNSNRTLMYPASGLGDHFVSTFDEGYQAMLVQAIERWTPVLRAAPDRVLWGTDVSADWHLHPEVYRRLVQFTSDFSDALPPELQAPFAYQNALNLLTGAQGMGEAVTR